jgi:hypothetical protein
MFDSISEEMKKSEGPPERPAVRLLRYAGVAAAAIGVLWGLCAAILLLE